MFEGKYGHLLPDYFKLIKLEVYICSQSSEMDTVFAWCVFHYYFR